MFGIDRLLKWIDAKDGRDLIFYSVLLVMTAFLCIYLHLKCCTQMETYDSLKDVVNPLEMKHGVYGKIGFMLGIFTGWIMERRFIKFDIQDGINLKKVLSVISGIVILYILMMCLNKIFVIFIAKHITAAIIAFLTAFYITFLYPLVLKRL